MVSLSEDTASREMELGVPHIKRLRAEKLATKGEENCISPAQEVVPAESC